MHVESRFERIADIGATLECLRAERHQRMQAEHRRHLAIIGVAAFTDVTLVLFDAFAVAITVGYLVAKTAAQTHVFECLLDLVETAVPTGRRSVVIDDGRAARTRGMHDGQQRGVIDVFGVERGVEFPPEVLEVLFEILRHRAGWREAAREGRVEMMVRVNQPGHDKAATGINGAVCRMGACVKITDSDDPAAFNVNTAAVDEAIVFIERDQASIGDQQRTHRNSLFLLRIDCQGPLVGRGYSLYPT